MCEVEAALVQTWWQLQQPLQSRHTLTWRWPGTLLSTCHSRQAWKAHTSIIFSEVCTMNIIVFVNKVWVLLHVRHESML